MTDEKKNAFTKDTIFSVTPAHLSKVNKITQAPPPIRPVSGLGLVRTSTNKPHEKQEVFIPVDGVELTNQWAVDWKCLFDLARQGVLIPDEPKHIQNCIDCDFGMLSNYPPDEIDGYFSQWLYNPQTIEKFEAEHPDIIEAWQKKVKTSDDKEQKQDATETTPAPQIKPLANTDTEAEEFIRSLQISYLDNTEVKIQYRGKSKNWNCDALGFRDSNTKEWKDFLGILKDRDHVYILGPAYSINKGTQQKERNTDYDKNLKLLKEIDKKLIIFLNKNYPVIFPEKFHLYERRPDKGDGIYSFKFKTPSTKPSYKSKEQALDRLEKLVLYGASIDAISDAVVIAMDVGASKDEVTKIVKDIDIGTSQNENMTDDLEKDGIDELY
jgi:hypothetical protein